MGPEGCHELRFAAGSTALAVSHRKVILPSTTPHGRCEVSGEVCAAIVSLAIRCGHYGKVCTVDDGCRLKDNGRLYLQHVGHIKVKLHRPVQEPVKTVSVNKSCAKWHVIFVCDVGDAPLDTRDGPAVGIDLAPKSFLSTSESETVEPPRYYRRAQRKLRGAQRALSLKGKGSKRRGKARVHVARLHGKTANQRRDFHPKTARKLVERHGLIVHDALNVKGIARTRLAKFTHDAGWARFLDILASKAEEAGVRVIVVDPKNTTQACSRCGDVPRAKRTLSVRVHRCEACGYTADRMSTPHRTFSRSHGAFKRERIGMPAALLEKLTALAVRVVTRAR